MVSVCIIGAGAAGLCAARQMSRSKSITRLTVIESSSQLGGTWVYTDIIGPGIHSSMYKNMRTNLPKEVMGFPDFPFPNNGVGASFIGHSQVLDYLKLYAAHFDLHKYIKYNHVVKKVNLGPKDNKWHVTIHPIENEHNKTEDIYDSVFVCNGHYFVPLIPDIPSHETFTGEVAHSHNYRTPELYKGKTALCLGSGPSGIDISIELATVCEKVYLSHNHSRITSSLPQNVVQVPGLTKFTPTGGVVGDDVIDFDIIMYCTGYEILFPFFDDSVDVKSTNNRITPLYQHFIHSNHPNLFLIGLCQKICPFPFFHVQIQYALSLLEGKAELKSVEEMIKWEEDDFRMRKEDFGMKDNLAHFMGKMQWPYLQDLANFGNFENPVLPVITELYNEIHKYRAENMVTYKDENFKIMDNQTFVHIKRS